MDLETVMNSMKADEDRQKVAAAPVAETVETKLAAALHKSAGATPVAAPSSDANAVDSLFKIAEQIAGTEKEAEYAMAAMLGAAFADSAITKFAMYQQEADKLVAKTAAVNPQAQLQQAYLQGQQDMQQKLASEAKLVTSDDSVFTKMAAEMGYNDTMVKVAFEKLSEDDLVKVAAEMGYNDTVEKVAAEYNAGHDAALQEVHDIASTEFLKGAAEAEILIAKAASQR